MGKLPDFYGIIPARYGSTRFPGKPLADILGKPMFWHVYTRASRCPELAEVVLATDDDRIAAAARKLDVPVLMTRPDHVSGTDRVLEAADLLGIPPHTIVVNIQGDEPALEPMMLSEMLQPFTNPDVRVTTLAKSISSEQAASPDVVKVVFSKSGQALYFSRSAIPYPGPDQKVAHYGHIGIYAFRLDALKRFVASKPSRLEMTEKLEQLRLLENDIPITVVLTAYESISVDRPEDILRVSKILGQKTG